MRTEKGMVHPTNASFLSCIDGMLSSKNFGALSAIAAYCSLNPPQEGEENKQ